MFFLLLIQLFAICKRLCYLVRPWNMSSLNVWKQRFDHLSFSEKKIRQRGHMWPWSTKPVLRSTGIFEAIANNTLDGSKLSMFLLCQKSNQIKIKSLLLSHHHSTSALVSEILMSVLQTVQKNNRQFTYGQTVQKNYRQFTYGQTVQKNNNRQFTYGQTVQKTALEHLQCSRQCKKTTTAIYIWTDSAKKQQQFTYGQYIFTDCTEDNVQNTHTYTQYT